VASSRARRHAVRLLAARAGAACLPLDPVITTGDSSPNSTVDKRLRPELCEMIGLRLRCGAVGQNSNSISVLQPDRGFGPVSLMPNEPTEGEGEEARQGRGQGAGSREQGAGSEI
jgi:hypothetical protein